MHTKFPRKQAFPQRGMYRGKGDIIEMSWTVIKTKSKLSGIFYQLWNIKMLKKSLMPCL